jgi:hypothetical protein
LIVLVIILNVDCLLEKKTRVLLIGIDGLLQRCIDKANISAFKYMMSMGSYTFKSRTAVEAVSGTGWSNILCGMDTESSGVTDNNWIAPWYYNKSNQITPISGNDSPLPCIFEL